MYTFHSGRARSSFRSLTWRSLAEFRRSLPSRGNRPLARSQALARAWAEYPGFQCLVGSASRACQLSRPDAGTQHYFMCTCLLDRGEEKSEERSGGEPRRIHL